MNNYKFSIGLQKEFSSFLAIMIIGSLIGTSRFGFAQSNFFHSFRYWEYDVKNGEGIEKSSLVDPFDGKLIPQVVTTDKMREKYMMYLPRPYGKRIRVDEESIEKIKIKLKKYLNNEWFPNDSNFKKYLEIYETKEVKEGIVHYLRYIVDEKYNIIIWDEEKKLYIYIQCYAYKEKKEFFELCKKFFILPSTIKTTGENIDKGFQVRDKKETMWIRGIKKFREKKGKKIPIYIIRANIKLEN